MHKNSTLASNVLLLRGAALWLLMALCLAWCLVFLKFDLAFIKAIFPGKFTRVLQAHLDFLLMSALLFGFFAAKVPLPAPCALVHGHRRIHQFQFIYVVGDVSGIG